MRFIFYTLSSMVLIYSVEIYAAENGGGADERRAPTCWERCQQGLRDIGEALGILQGGGGGGRASTTAAATPAPAVAPEVRGGVVIPRGGVTEEHAAVEGEDPMPVSSVLRHRGGHGGGAGSSMRRSRSSSSHGDGEGGGSAVASSAGYMSGGGGGRTASRSPSRTAATAAATSDERARRLLGLGERRSRAEEIAQVEKRLRELALELTAARESRSMARCDAVKRAINELHAQVQTLRYERDPGEDAR